jgi:site-specific DNA recombinase
VRTAIYARISQDVSGLSENVAIQLEECLSHLNEQGWEAVGRFSDNDVSASAYSTKPRPGYDALIASIEAGEVEAVLITEMSRLYRRLEELLGLFQLAKTTPLRRVVTTDGISYDLSTPEGIHNAVAAVNNAILESAKLSQRLIRKKSAKAKLGAFGGGPRPFGFEKDGVTIREREAEALRYAASRVLEGASMRQVARELREQGIMSRNGTHISPSNLRRQLESPRIVGLRKHQGKLYPAQWPAIIDQETQDRLKLIFSSEERFRSWEKKGGRTHLLTGLLECGKCGGLLMGGKNNGKRGYQCRGPDVNIMAPVHLRRAAEPLELLVTEAARYRLDSMDLGRLYKDDGQPRIRALLDDYNARKLKLDDLVADYASGLLNREQLAQAKAIVERAIEDVKARIDKLQRNRVLAAVPVGRTLSEAWAEHADDQDWQRAMLGLVIEKVIVKPVGHGAVPKWRGFQFDPSPRAIEIVWEV